MRQTAHLGGSKGFEVFKQIAVGTDGSDGASLAVDKAIELAALTGATLHVVTAHKLATSFALAAASDIGVPAANIMESNEEIRSKAERVCQEAARRADAAGVKAESHVVPGDAADALLEVVEAAHCDLLVVGNRGMTGARRFVLGSVPNKLSHHATASLLIIDTSETRT